jgi:hypothetical protein
LLRNIFGQKIVNEKSKYCVMRNFAIYVSRYTLKIVSSEELKLEITAWKTKVEIGG